MYDKSINQNHLNIFRFAKVSKITFGVKGAFYENFRPTKTWPSK